MNCEIHSLAKHQAGLVFTHPGLNGGLVTQGLCDEQLLNIEMLYKKGLDYNITSPNFKI